MDHLVLSSPELEVAVQFHLIGTGPEEYEQRLQKQIRSDAVTEKVTWHGYVDHDDLPDILSDMDAAISPLPDHDSYEVSSPAKVYEYLAMGLPVICTDIRAHRTVIKEGCTGLFYQPGSEESLVVTLNGLVHLTESEWREFRQSARNSALENDWSVRLNQIKSVLDHGTT